MLPIVMEPPLSSSAKGWERAQYGAQKTFSSVKVSPHKSWKLISHMNTITVHKHPLMPCSVVLPAATTHDLLYGMCNKIFWCEEAEWGKLTMAPIDHPAISEFPLPAYT